MTSLSFLPRSCLVALAAIATTTAQWQDSYRLDFSYEATSENGPENWDQVDVSGSEWERFPALDLSSSENECGSELRPSPINLFANSPCRDTREILTRIIREDDCTQDDLTFDITPHGLRAYFPTDDTGCRRPRMVLNGVNGPYLLSWMDLRVRAEHVVDGRRYDAELQMVHVGLRDVTERMAIVSVFIEANSRQDNPEMQSLLDAWQEVANEETIACSTGRRSRGLKRRMSDESNHEYTASQGQSTYFDEDEELKSRRRNQAGCVPDRFGAGCEPFAPRRKQYPYNLWPSIWYYRYSGSLTTPPCASVVNWRVIDVPMKISRRQFKQMAKLIKASKDLGCADDTGVSLTGENFRPLQEAQNNQNVAHCTFDDFGFSVYPPDLQ